MTGTMASNGAVVITPSAVTQTIAAGHHDGQGYVPAMPTTVPRRFDRQAPELKRCVGGSADAGDRWTIQKYLLVEQEQNVPAPESLLGMVGDESRQEKERDELEQRPEKIADTKARMAFYRRRMAALEVYRRGK